MLQQKLLEMHSRSLQAIVTDSRKDLNMKSRAYRWMSMPRNKNLGLYITN